VDVDSSEAIDDESEPRFRLTSSPATTVPLASRFSPRVFFGKLFSVDGSTFLTLFDGVNLTGLDGTDFDTSRGRRTS
jgi:hypothetical protein